MASMHRTIAIGRSAWPGPVDVMYTAQRGRIDATGVILVSDEMTSCAEAGTSITLTPFSGPGFR